jgi:hypothetical protein
MKDYKTWEKKEKKRIFFPSFRLRQADGDETLEQGQIRVTASLCMIMEKSLPPSKY